MNDTELLAEVRKKLWSILTDGGRDALGDIFRTIEFIDKRGEASA